VETGSLKARALTRNGGAIPESKFTTGGRLELSAAFGDESVAVPDLRRDASLPFIVAAKVHDPPQ
jgi:hypothetical protein